MKKNEKKKQFLCCRASLIRYFILSILLSILAIAYTNIIQRLVDLLGGLKMFFSFSLVLQNYTFVCTATG